MIIQLHHNKIVKETISDKFVESVNAVLVPILKDKYGDRLSRILMYEDYIADRLELDGEWYYPLTLEAGGEVFTQWIKWDISSRKHFPNQSPYAYVGEDLLSFSLIEELPSGFEDKLSGRAIDYPKDTVKLAVHAAAQDPLVLSGRYSQTFIDELARQVTDRLSLILGVEGLAGSSIELQLVFAPGTYMEHTSENVTYRRLLLTDKSCQARDFWVKWTHLGSAVGCTVGDHIAPTEVMFDLGEDVPQKIREKEFRFLCNSNPDKYQSAMGKKTVTEWREVIKRAIRRGDLTKTVSEFELADHADTLSEKLGEILGERGIEMKQSTASVVEDESSFSSVMDMARAALAALEKREETVADDDVMEAEDNVLEAVDSEPDAFDAAISNGEGADLKDTADASACDFSNDIITSTQEAYADTDTLSLSNDTDMAEETVCQADIEDAYEADYIEASDNTSAKYNETERDREINDKEQIDAMRAALEAEIRLEYESRARERAEQQAEALRIHTEALKAENERLIAMAKQAEEQRVREELERAREAERARQEKDRLVREAEALRAEIDTKNRQEAREKDRLAEAARIAVEEQRRLEAQQAEREAYEREARELRERERRIREETERIEAQRRIQADKLRAEEEARAASAPGNAGQDKPAYISKRAKLIFRKTADLNVIKRIKEIVEKTLIASHKEHIHIHIKAYPQDANTISLDILRIPSNEGNLLIDIIKAIGNGGLGISKITLE